jgi:hypothetical protein
MDVVVSVVNQQGLYAAQSCRLPTHEPQNRTFRIRQHCGHFVQLSQYGMRYKELITAASLITIAVPSGAEEKALMREHHSTEDVRGVLALHWEYPYFIRRNKLKEQVFEIRIEDAKWIKNHLPKRTQETMFSETLLCISGVGYEDRKRIGETGRATFVFVLIKSTTKIQTRSECA